MERRTKVYFGYIENDGLVFVTAEDADLITRLEYARLNAGSWSEFATALREQGFPEDAAEIEGDLACGDIDDDDFEAFKEACYGDGDWGGL